MLPPQTLAEEYFMKGSALDVDESRHNAAATWYRKALEIDPYLVPALINLANIHYGKDELAEAQALYERAIGLDPDFFEAHFNLGNIYHDLGRFQEAATCYRTALRLNGQYADAHFYLAITLEKTGHSPKPSRTGARISSSRRTANGWSWRGSFLNSDHWQIGRLEDWQISENAISLSDPANLPICQ